MAANPLIDQGTLNRIRGSVVVPDFPILNVTAAFLGKGAISVALQGESTLFIPTMTGAVTSPEPYMIARVTVNLLKTQQLATLYKQRMELDARLGPIQIIPDAANFPNYDFFNAAISAVREMSMAGDDPGFVVSLQGYYNVNSSLWNLI
jgi:hypothetical protein